MPIEPLVCMLSIPSLPQLRPTPLLPSLSMQEVLVEEDEETPPPPPPSKALLQRTLSKEVLPKVTPSNSLTTPPSSAPLTHRAQRRRSFLPLNPITSNNNLLNIPVP